VTAPGGSQRERSRPTILVVEDEKDILDLIAFNLERERYKVLTARTGEEALDLLSRQPVQLVVLDVLLPGIDGFEVCRRLRADLRHAGTPILMLTAKTEDVDIVAGLELGAEDYVTKPFSPRVLLARVRAILRRRERPESDTTIVRSGDLEIDPGRHLVRLHDEPVLLTLTEFRILQLLAGRPGWVFTRNQLLDGVQGTESFVLDRTVDVHIGSLRKKLGEYGSRIETVRGLGYRLSDAGS
jgi:two-component system, OmpR family, alkaline phosphatase synthesis response regulator PhoP